VKRKPSRRQAETTRSIPVRTATVQTRDLVETLSLTGTLNPRSQVTVVPEISARLDSVLKAEGDRVGRGELLAVLDDADFRLSRDRAKAHLDVAQANSAHARAEQDRADSLVKTGGITDKDHLSAKVAVQVADASEAQAKSELAITERQIERARITAADRWPDLEAPCRRRNHCRCRNPALYDRRRFGVRIPVVGRVGRFRQGQGGETVNVTVDALPGFSVQGEGKPHRSAG
jgi:multidrug efflux pump subunit AcrA (membrane-fusion protein)